MPTLAVAGAGGGVRLAGIGGVAALLGGLAWTVKGVMILAVGDQPPVLFEAAPALFGVGLLGVAQSTMARGRRRTTAVCLGAGAALAGFVALMSDVVGELLGGALAVSTVALLVGLLMVERNSRWPARLAWWIGVAMVPALAVGGVLAEIDEDLLEIPIVFLGVAWMMVGLALLRRPAAT
jgi:hypothetical protein